MQVEEPKTEKQRIPHIFFPFIQNFMMSISEYSNIQRLIFNFFFQVSQVLNYDENHVISTDTRKSTEMQRKHWKICENSGFVLSELVV